jgi:hypothetical protein
MRHNATHSLVKEVVMTITLRGLIVLVPVLLVACATIQELREPCPPPGEPSGTLQRCFYVLQVTKIDPIKKEVTAITHPRKTITIEDEEYDYYGGPKGDVFTFKVKDFDILTAPGGRLEAQPIGTADPRVHLFISESDSATLEAYPEATVTKLLKAKKLKNFKYKEHGE